MIGDHPDRTGIVYAHAALGAVEQAFLWSRFGEKAEIPRASGLLLTTKLSQQAAKLVQAPVASTPHADRLFPTGGATTIACAELPGTTSGAWLWLVG